MDKRNHQDDNNAEISKTAVSMANVMKCILSMKTQRWVLGTLNQPKGFIVYDDSIVPEPRFFVTYYYDSNSIMHGYLSDDSYVYEFSNKSGMHFVDERVHFMALMVFQLLNT